MEKCVCCGQETPNTAIVYMKKTGQSPVSQTEFFCPDCAKKRSGILPSIVFYLALQLCWFTVVKSGLLTPFGILAACIAIAALCRLAALIFRRLAKRSDGHLDEEESSEALKQALIEQDNDLKGQVLSLREYRRIYGDQ